MKNAFIVERFSIKEDWEESVSQINVLAENGDEGEILFETTDGIFEPLLQVRQELIIQTKKFQPKFWYNLNLISQLNLTIPMKYGKS